MTIRDVAQSQLCCGCGACAYVSPDQIEMVDDLDQGRRPLTRPDRGDGGDEALQVCPGILLQADTGCTDGLIDEVRPAWGPVRAVFEGHACDTELRRAGSSGGAVSALALYCIEQAGFHGVLHIAAREDVPYLNRTVLSTTRAQLLARTGSRYAPASPCDGLAMIEEAPGPCAFIGKPCDVAAVHKACRLRPRLRQKLGLTIAFFCAGTPSTRGTLELLQEAGVHDPGQVQSIRYRGDGWPGRWTVNFRDRQGLVQQRTLTYEQSWGRLTHHKQWRCHLCVDHSGEFADVSMGDPWHRAPRPDEPGSSLVLSRTTRGAALVEAAMRSGYLSLRNVRPSLITASQPELLRARASVWGRMLALRMAGLPVPRYENMPALRHWLGVLSLRDKARSILGTWRRIARRGLRTPRPVETHEPVPTGASLLLCEEALR